MKTSQLVWHVYFIQDTPTRFTKLLPVWPSTRFNTLD